MDAEAAGFAVLVPGTTKHAGHPQGQAELETAAQSTWAIDLTGPPAEIAVNDVAEGHYFDGSLRLSPCTDSYAPIFADSHLPVGPDHDLWGHTLLLRGTATRDASSVYSFDVTVDVEAIVAGIEYAATVRTGGATVITTMIDLAAIFEVIDFADLADEDGKIVLNARLGGDIYEEVRSRLADPRISLHKKMEPVPVH